MTTNVLGTKWVHGQIIAPVPAPFEPPALPQPPAGGGGGGGGVDPAPSPGLPSVQD